MAQALGPEAQKSEESSRTVSMLAPSEVDYGYQHLRFDTRRRTINVGPRRWVAVDMRVIVVSDSHARFGTYGT